MATVTLAASERRFECTPGDTLLRAGLRAGIGLSYECNAGSCGTCKIDLVSGEVDDLYPEAPGIKPRDRERGRRLACQSVPKGDCTIKSRVADSYLTPNAPRRRTARLESSRDITHDIREFTFRAEGAAAFLAGQYAMLVLPRRAGAARLLDVEHRQRRGRLEVHDPAHLRRASVSRALFELAPGSAVELDGPYGSPTCARTARATSSASPAARASRRWPRSSTPRPRTSTCAISAPGCSMAGAGPADVPAIADLLATHHLERGLEWHPVVSVPRLA
jgi:toluene monooxygenase electron transfer component